MPSGLSTITQIQMNALTYEIMVMLRAIVLVLMFSTTTGTAMAQVPTYDCDEAEINSIEAMICQDKDLSRFDRELSDVYGAASKKATNEHLSVLKAEQRGWIKGRDDCWKNDDKRRCVRDEYQRRIVELQAKYRLVPSNGPVEFVCKNKPESQVFVTFFKTNPPTLIAKHGDGVSLMYLQRSASGARYEGRNEVFWEHQGEALITWGNESTQMHCTKM